MCLFRFQNLALVLEMAPLSFGIRLASLAYRKGLIDLERWLSSHLNNYRDYFFEVMLLFQPVSNQVRFQNYLLELSYFWCISCYLQHCLVFLKQISLGEVQNVSPKSLDDCRRLGNLYAETKSTFIKVLHCSSLFVSIIKKKEFVLKFHSVIMKSSIYAGSSSSY